MRTPLRDRSRHPPPAWRRATRFLARPRSLAAFLLAAAIGLAADGSAQSIPTYADPIQFTAPGASDFFTGHIDHTTTLVVQGRNPGRPWTLSLRSQNPNLGGYGKPLTHVLWRLDGTSTWTPLTTSFVDVFGERGTHTIVVHFRVLLFWHLDLPEIYETTISWRVVD